jgi:HEAT repeat protein
MMRSTARVCGLFLLLASTGAGSGPSVLAQAPAPAASSSTSVTNPIAGLLKSPYEKVRIRAARDLGSAQDISAIPALAEALSDPSEKVRREVVLALAQMHHSAALDALIKATHDQNEDIPVLAVQSLVGFYTGTVPSSGFGGFVKKNWQRAKGHFEPDTVRIDPGLAVDPKVVGALEASLNSTRSNRTSREAAKGLGILVVRAAVPDLVKAAHSSDEALSLEALNALGKIEDRSAGPQLVDLLDSPDKEIKQEACVTVGILRTRQAAAKLESIYQNGPEPKTEEKAMEGLAYLGAPSSVPLFVKALGHIDKVVRTAAAEGLARAADPKALPQVEQALSTERDADVRLALEFAATALGKFDYLDDLVNELSSRTRWDVAQPYLVELARNRAFLPRLYPYLQSPTTDVRMRLCTVLMFSGDATSLEQLDRLSHDRDGEVAAQALRAKRALRARLDAAGSNPGAGRT